MEKKIWTIIVQISGENDLLMDSISAFNEIASYGSTDEINFIVLMDRMKVEGELPEKYKGYEFLLNPDAAKPCVYYSKKQITYDKAKPFKVYENDDLVNPDNLSEIIKKIKEDFPAKNLGYIYKGHGQPGGTDVDTGTFVAKIFKVEMDEYNSDGSINKDKLLPRLRKIIKNESKGWRFYDEYFVLDDNETRPRVVLAMLYKGDEKFLTYKGLEKALSQALGNDKFEFLLLDCCWGMMMENVHQFKDVTKYFIASEDEMPALGMGYSLFVKLITEKPGLKPHELAKMLVSVFYSIRFDDYLSSEEFKYMGISLTCTESNLYTDMVFTPLKKLIKNLRDNMPQHASDIYKSLGKCRDFTYSKSTEYDMYNLDLIWFLENLFLHTNDIQLKIDISTTILNIRLYLTRGHMENNYDTPSLTNKERYIGARGIAITFPKTEGYYKRSILNQNKGIYLPFFVETYWRDMVRAFYKYNKRISDLIEIISTEKDNDTIINWYKKLDVDLKPHSSDFTTIRTGIDIQNKSYNLKSGNFSDLFKKVYDLSDPGNEISDNNKTLKIFLDDDELDSSGKWKKL